MNTELVRDVLLERRDRGRTTLLSTHQMPMVETLCDRVVLLATGRVLLAGTVTELRAAHGDRSMDSIFVATVVANGGPS